MAPDPSPGLWVGSIAGLEVRAMFEDLQNRILCFGGFPAKIRRRLKPAHGSVLVDRLVAILPA